MDAPMQRGGLPNFIWRMQPRLQTVPTNRTDRLTLMAEIEEEVEQSKRYIRLAKTWRVILAQEDQKQMLSQLPDSAGPRMTVDDVRMDRRSSSSSPARKKSAAKRTLKEMGKTSDSSAHPSKSRSSKKSSNKSTESMVPSDTDDKDNVAEPDKKRRRKKDRKSRSSHRHRSSSECKKKMKRDKKKRSSKHKRKRKRSPSASSSGGSSSVSSSEMTPTKSTPVRKKTRNKRIDTPSKTGAKRGPNAYHLYIKDQKAEGVSIAESRSKWREMTAEAKTPWTTRAQQMKEQLNVAGGSSPATGTTKSSSVSAAAAVTTADKDGSPSMMPSKGSKSSSRKRSSSKSRGKSQVKPLKPIIKRRASVGLSAKAAALEKARNEQSGSSQPNRKTAKIKPVTSKSRAEESSDSEDDTSSSMESSSDDESPNNKKNNLQTKYLAKRTGPNTAKSSSQKVNSGIVAGKLSDSEEE